MATKLKNIKNSLLLKIIAFVLAIVMCLGFVRSAYVVVKGLMLFSTSSITKSEPSVFDYCLFNMTFNGDMEDIEKAVNYDTDVEKYEKKKVYVSNQALKHFKLAQEYYNYSERNNYDIDDNGEYVSETETYNIAGEEFLVYGEDLPSYYEAMNINGYQVCFTVPIYYSEEDAKQSIEEQINENYSAPSKSGDMNFSDVKNLTFYALGNNGNIVTNSENPEEFINNITKQNSYYYYNKDGVFSAGLFGDNFSCAYQDFAELYVSFDPEFKADDVYREMYLTYKANKDVNYGEQLFTALAFLAGIILMLILSCTLAGHKNGTLVTAAIDKLPNDLHLVISAALLACLCALVEVAVNLCIDYKLHIPLYEVKWAYAGLNAVVCAGYVVILELFTSVCRQVKSHSGYFKNTLIYKLCTLIKKAISNARQIAIYKPENFMARIIVAIVAYCVISAFLFVLVCSAFAAEEFAVAFIMAFILFAITAGGWFFAIRYIINLDKIITSAHNRTTPDVNYDKLPNSLKTLVNSLAINKEELNRAVDKAVRDEHMRTELITNVSHDLKTPLTSIINYVDLLDKCNIEDETAREYISILDDKSEKLKHLIEDLIEASKATSGVISVNLVNINLCELVTQAVVEHQQEFSDNNLELISKGENKNITAVADGQKAYRVIENLLSNALKYSAKGSRVYIDVYSEGKNAVFEIKNISGEPLDITPYELKERFVRGDKSRNKDGNGLGLSIADSFCNAMNGKLELIIDGDLFKARVILPIE